MPRSKRLPMILSAIVFTVMLASCATQMGATHSHESFDWAREDPLAFLAFLQTKKDDPCPTVVVPEIPDAWLTKEHLSRLQVLLDSREPCANVHSIYSSFRDCRISTVGHEAAFLMEGFRKGSYPPEMNSGGAELDMEALRRL